MIPAVMPTYARVPLSFERGEGCWLIDAKGERYLDFASGIAVTALGHAHPRLIAALTEQAGKVWHTSNLFRIPGQERLAEMLVEMTFADTAFFTNSGAEAMECAIKTARKYHSANGHPERWRIITVEGSFHGRTLATIAAAGQDKLTAGFGPMPGGFDHVPFGDLDAMRAAITPETAAICVEPVQGEGGIRPFSAADLKAMRKMCDENGLLLILDEIQTGVGRTGKLFAHELAGVTPDIMAVAKGIGGGFPLGACLATEEAAKGMVAGTHGSTYGGNPLAVAVGATLLEIVSDPEFLENVRRSAGALRQGLEGLVASHPDVLEAVRGEGLLIGLKCKVPASDLIAAAREEKMIVPPAGDNVVRILPPLIVGEEEIAAGLERLDAACRRVEQSAA